MDRILPGKLWLDAKGEPIEAHGGTMFQENGRYFWIGEDKSHNHKRGKTWTWGIRCYSSSDLVNWTDEGHIVPPDPDKPESLFYPSRRLDRPHLLKNPTTGQYVLWLKYCDRDHYTVMTADALRGPYTVAEPFLQPYGHHSGDFDLALDAESGCAYLYFEADHQLLLVAKLNERFTNVEGEPSIIYEKLTPPFTREAPAHFQRGGKHYLITSGMSGYVPNPTEIAVAEDWMGPYTVLGDPCLDDKSGASFNSQPSHVFRVDGSETYIMMADRWVPDFLLTAEKTASIRRAILANTTGSEKKNLRDTLILLRSPLVGPIDTSRARYVWLPFVWEGDRPRLRWRDAWNPEDYLKMKQEDLS